jgi:hypothetical protein
MEVILNLPQNGLDQDFCYLQTEIFELIAFKKIVCLQENLHLGSFFSPLIFLTLPELDTCV